MQTLFDRLRRMPLFWLSSAFLLGLPLGRAAPLPWAAWLGAAAAMALLAAGEARRGWLRGWRRFSPIPAGAALALLCLGAARYQAWLPVVTPDRLAWYNGGGTLHMLGTVKAVPTHNHLSVRLRVSVDALLPPEEEAFLPVSGMVLVYTEGREDWQYGDRVELVGSLQTPSEDGDFSYRDYLARQGIHSVMWRGEAHLLGRGGGSPLLRAVYSLRMGAYRVINDVLPQPEAALLAGILLGIEDDLPDRLMRAYQASGTAHIIAISGFNISVVAGLLVGAASRVTRRRSLALGLAAAGIAFYTLLAGAGSPVLRAAIMGALSMLGHFFGRRQSGENMLAFTAAVMSLFNPSLPWDASFQLSFCATLGLVVYANPLQEGFLKLLRRFLPPGKAASISAAAGGALLTTIAAQITTFPVIAYHFQRVSLVSLPANLLILPPQPWVMIVGGAAALGGMVFLPLGEALGWLAYPLLAYSNAVAQWLGSLPWAQSALYAFPLRSAAAYTLLAALVSLALMTPRPLKQKFLLRRLAPAALLALTLISLSLWRAVLPQVHAPSERVLRLTVFDLPGGGAVIVQSPTGSVALLNGSSSARSLSARLSQALSPFQRSPDVWLFYSDNWQTLEGSMSIFEGHPPRQVMWNEAAAGQNPLSDVSASVELEKGQTLAFESGLTMQVLESGAQGTALLLEWEQLRILLPGGVPMEYLATKYALKGVSLLVLQPSDLAAGENWGQLHAQAVICSGEGCGGDSANWAAVPTGGWVRVETNGKAFWLSRGQ